MEASRPARNIPARELRLNRRAITFLICLLIASLLWMLISLSEDYLERRYFSVTYANVPADVVLGSLPDTLSVEFSATGFNLLFHDPGGSPVTIDLSRAQVSHNQLHYFLTNTMLAKQFTRQFGSGMRVVRMQPDSLKAMRIKGEGRWMKVRFNGVVDLPPYLAIVGSIRVSPDSVLVRGTIEGDYLTVGVKEVKGKEGVNLIKVPVERPGNGAVLENDSASLQFITEKFTEKQFEIPVSILNLPTQYSFKSVPKTVVVKCLVPFSDLQSVEAAMFSAAVDYKELSGTSINKAKVNVSCTNSKVRNLRGTPERVDFILRKAE